MLTRYVDTSHICVCVFNLYTYITVAVLCMAFKKSVDLAMKFMFYLVIFSYVCDWLPFDHFVNNQHFLIKRFYFA